MWGNEMQRPSTSILLSWCLFAISTVVVVPSLLFFGKNGLGFSLADVLDQLVRDWNDWLHRNFGLVVEPYVEELLQLLRESFGLQLQLQSHWQHVFIVMWLFLSAYGKARATSLADALFDPVTWWRLSSAFVVALIFALATGTVALTALGVITLPVAGFYVFLSLNQLGSRSAAYLRRAFYWALAGVLFAWVLPFGFPLFNGWAPSPALLALIGIVLIFALYLLLVGWPDNPEVLDEKGWLAQRRSDPGTRMALSILAPIAIAFLATWQGHHLPQSQPEREVPRVFTDGSFEDCDGCPRMVRIPAGAFIMGSDAPSLLAGQQLGFEDGRLAMETPARRVRTPGFALGMTEVTRGQFAKFVGETQHSAEGFCGGFDERTVKHDHQSNRSWRNPGFSQDDDHPVVCITQWDAIRYADWLSRKTGHVYRLPTEVEWEYAARADSMGSRYWGEANAAACSYANVFDRTAEQSMGKVLPDERVRFRCSDGYAYTAPVGRFKPNAFGLHDMLGNAAEWTLDCFRFDYIAAPPANSLSYARSCGGAFLSELGGIRVVRGGGWASVGGDVRSATRFLAVATRQNSVTGFRVVRVD